MGTGEEFSCLGDSEDDIFFLSMGAFQMRILLSGMILGISRHWNGRETLQVILDFRNPRISLRPIDVLPCLDGRDRSSPC